MAGKELISEIVDKSSVKKDLSELSEMLSGIDSQIKNMAQVSISGRKNGSDFKATAEKMQQEIAKTETLLQNLEKAIADKEAALVKLNDQVAKSSDAKIKKLESDQRREKKINDDAINDYKQLSAAYNDAALRAKNYALTLGMSHPVTLQAIQDANGMGETLKKLDASVGQHQRNVGNYASGWTSFNNVIRETPNFAISAQTGIQALSNNIPMFADEIKKARTEGKSWTGILKELGANLFSFGGIATIATIALTALPKILSEMSNSADNAAKAMERKAKAVGVAKGEIEKLNEISEKYNESLSSNNLSAEREITNLRILEKVALDTSKSLNVREGAVKKIQELYPAYLNNLTQDEVLSGKAASAINEITNALYKKAIAEAAASRSAETAKSLLDLRKEEADLLKKEQDAREKLAKEKNTTKGLILGGSTTGVTGKEVTEYDKLFDKLLKVKNRIEENRAAQILFGRDIQFYNDEAAKLYDQYVKLEETKTTTTATGVTKGKELKDDERKFLYEINKMILEDTAKTLEQIAKDTENSYEVRATALQELYKKQNEIAILTKNFELGTAKITATEKLRINTEYSLKVVDNEGKMLTSLNELHKEHQKQLRDEQKKADDEAKKQREEDVESGMKEVASRVLRDQEQMNQALIDLNRAYINGEFKSYEDFEKEKERITLEYTQKGIQHQIDAAKKLIASKKLNADQEQKYLTEIAELEKKLIDAGIAYNKKKGDETEKDGEKRKAKLVKDLTEIQQMVSNMTQAITDVASVGFEKKKVELEEERTMIEKNNAAEVKRINDSTLSEEEKANRLKILEADKQVKLEANERKNRQLQYEKAKFERAINIGNIIAGTALAVVKALPNIPLAVTVGLLGAAQLYKAIATPLPKFEKGTDSSPEGWAITDEKGAEKYIEPDGTTYMGSDKGPTLRYLKRGTKIIPHNEVNRMMMNNMIARTASALDRPDMSAKKLDELKEATIWSTARIEKAISKQKGTVVIVNNNSGFHARITENINA